MGVSERLAARDPEAGRAVLDEVGEDPAALAAHAEALAACGLTAAWAERAAGAATPELLEVFARLWHPSDEAVAASWLAAAEALGASVPEAVREAAERHRARGRLRDKARRARGDSPLVRRWLESPLVLRVRCEGCGRDAVHETPVALFDPEAHGASASPGAGVYVPRVLECPFCGAADAYELDPEAAREVATRALAAARRPGRWTVQPGRAALADGTPIRRPSEGLRRLRERAEARPDDPAAWRFLANFAVRADRLDVAREAWRRGASLEDDFDCALALAIGAASEPDAEPEALFEAVARAVGRLPHADPERRPLQAAQLAEAVRAVRDAVEGPLTLVVGDRQLDVRALADWSRLGELLALARGAALRREAAVDPVRVVDALRGL
jgi:hypothetical protein